MTVYDQDQPKSNRVFISYSSIDRVRTNGLGLLLEAMGHRVFHDHRTIKPGMKWEAALQDGLDEADVVMVFWTKHAARSDWVRKEYEYFFATYPDRILVPVLADETPLTDILKTRQHADFAPVVNEVLALKRSMKAAGAGAGDIEKAVVERLDDAGVELKTKKQKRLLFLFLGFGWLPSLLRAPSEAVRKVGSGAVEKTAQVTAGQLAVIGVAGALGLAAGVPAAERLLHPDIIEAEQILPGETEPPSTAGGPAELWGDSLSDFRLGVAQSNAHVDQQLVAIRERLDDLVLTWADSLAQCRQEVLGLRAGGNDARQETPPVRPPAPDSPPAGLVATVAGFGMIDLAWEDLSTNEEGFEIARCEGANCTDFAAIARTGPGVTSFTDRGLSRDAIYRYQVRGFTAGGFTNFSSGAQSVVFLEGDELPEMRNVAEVMSVVESRVQDQTRGGTVTLAVFIDEDGRVRTDLEPTVVSNTGDAELVGAAIAGVKVARFTAAEKAGQRIALWVNVPITIVVRD